MTKTNRTAGLEVHPDLSPTESALYSNLVLQADEDGRIEEIDPEWLRLQIGLADEKSFWECFTSLIEAGVVDVADDDGSVHLTEERAVQFIRHRRPRSWMTDKRLSFRALGVLFDALANHEAPSFGDAAELATTRRSSASEVEDILRELETLGYITRGDDGLVDFHATSHEILA